MIQTLANFCDRHASDTLIVALSGGADSTALVVAATAMGRSRGLNVVAVHVNHGLRPDAEQDVRHCEVLCARLGIPLRIVRIQVNARNSRMHQARYQRYAALARIAREFGIDLVLTGHHADDVKENAIIREERESARFRIQPLLELKELGVSIGRPLLRTSRDDIEAWLTEQQFTWLSDPSNQDPRYARTRARNAVRRATALKVGEARNDQTVQVDQIARHIVRVIKSIPVESIAHALTSALPGVVIGKHHYQQLKACIQKVHGPYSVKGGVVWSDDAWIYVEHTHGQGTQNWVRRAEPLRVLPGDFPWFGNTITISHGPTEGAIIAQNAVTIEGWQPGLRSVAGSKVAELLRASGVPALRRWRSPCVIGTSKCVAVLEDTSTKDGTPPASTTSETWWIKMHDHSQ